jgi:hypothetical protein
MEVGTPRCIKILNVAFVNCENFVMDFVLEKPLTLKMKK